MEITEFIYFLTIILISAKLLGELARLVGQPPVVGELLAGIIIGPAVFGLIPDAELFYHNNIFYLLAEVGVVLLLFEIGLESDINGLLKVGLNSFLVGLSGIVLPFAIGFGFCHMIGQPVMVSMVVAASITATSIGITSKVFAELGYLNTKEARIVIGAAIIDDVIALAILGIISTMATSGEELNLKYEIITVLIALALLVGAVFLGKLLVNQFVSLLEKMKTRGVLITGALCFAFLFALIAYKVGSSIIIGSFAAGMLLAETRKKHDIEEALRPIVDFFTPIFFVSIGIAINLSVLNPFNPANSKILVYILIFLLIAIITKYLSGYSIISRENIDKRTIGISMIPRGEVGLIFASMGKITGVLNENVYAIIVVVVILTTIVVPPLLKWSIKSHNKQIEQA